MKIEVGTYHTRDGRTATVTEIVAEDQVAIGVVDGANKEWYLPDGNYLTNTVCEMDLVTRIHEPTQPEQLPVTTANPTTLEVRPTQWTVTPGGKPIFDEQAMTLKIEDEAAGEFLVLENCGDGDGFRFNPEDWPTLRALIDEAVKGVKR